MLNAAQQKEVRLTLLKSGISFYEVYEELSDHYLTAIEERMQEGASFDAALLATHKGFGGEEGVKKLEKSNRKHALRYYRSVHWQQFWERFRWPHICLVLLVGAFSFLLADLLQPKALMILIFLLSLFPFAIAGFAGKKMDELLWGNYVTLPKTIRGEALRQQGIASVSIFNVVYFGSKLIKGEEQSDALLEQLHPALFTGFLVLSFVWSWSFYLTVKSTKPKLA